MDKKTFQTLEFDKVLKILAGYTNFSAGEDLAHSVAPTTDIVEARRWQAETREAVLLLDTRSNITIGGARDVRRSVANAERGFTLPAEDLLAIRNTIASARTIKRQIVKAEEEFPHLADIAQLIEECPGIVSAISNTIDERGEVLDSASPKLTKIRQDQRIVHGRIQDKLQKILNSRQNQYLQEPIITMRSGRYVVPLKADAKGRIKGIVHDQSSRGATLWVEPIGTVDLNNDYRSLQLQEEEEINRILAELSGKIAEQGDSIQRVVERMAELDLIFAKARYAVVLDGVEPVFVAWRTTHAPKPPKHENERVKWTPPPRSYHPGSTIWVKGARHPLLDPNTVVPTNLTLDEETFIVLITGPNTGGKTVSLKTMGLMVLMAQSGLHLPAVEAKLTLFEDVFADIGDEQSIEQSLSTFSAHVTNIIRILAQIDEHSLVLLDELGSGTDPAEGAALAQSITQFLRDSGATTFIATHYPELKLYASQTEGATNASLLFDVETLSPTFEMTIGLPGKSNALAIARRLGMDETILADAIKLLGVGSREAENLLDSIYDLRDKMESEEAGIRLAQREVEEERDAWQRRLEQIDDERQRILAEAHEIAQEEIEAVQAEIRQARKRLRDVASLNQLKKLSKQVAEIEETQIQARLPVDVEVKPPPKRPSLQIGDTVLVKSLNVKGEVVNLSKKEAVIAVGRLQMRAKFDELEFKERKAEEEESDSVHFTRAATVKIDLDIRGRRVEDGLSELEKHLDSAFLARMPWVRIIHGKGTGKLRQAVRKSLRQNPHVASWEEGKDGEGGAGVTVAKLIEQG